MGSQEEDFLNSEDSKPDLEHLNSRYPVRFTSTISLSHVTFLDIDIFVDKSGFHTSIHIKPTNHQQNLHFSICHTPFIKQSITFSQALQGRHICNHPSDLSSFTSNLTSAFAS